MKVLIVDDHAVVREGIGRLIEGIDGAIVSQASSAEEALATVRQNKPDVIVLDINLGGSSGLELLQRLRTHDRSARIVMFTMYSDAGYAQRAMRGGASGYVSKSAPVEELITAIKSVAAGQTYVEKELAQDLAVVQTRDGDPMSNLTNREVEILRLLGEGKSFTQIAETFGIAYKTVANSCSRLKEKLGLERTADLIRLSVENSLRSERRNSE